MRFTWTIAAACLALGGANTAVAAEKANPGVVKEEPPKPRNLAQEEANRQLVLSFFREGDLEKAMAFVDDHDYKQHNPLVANGKAGVYAFFKDMRAKHPNMKATVYRSAAQDDLVWVHAHLSEGPNDPGTALVDIFRVRNGKLVEHWDIMQPVPKTSANPHSMFD